MQVVLQNPLRSRHFDGRGSSCTRLFTHRTVTLAQLLSTRKKRRSGVKSWEII